MPSINHKRKTSKKSKSSKRSKNANRNKKTRSNMRKMSGGGNIGDKVYSKITGSLLGKITEEEDRVYIIDKTNRPFVLKTTEELDWSTFKPDRETVRTTKAKQTNKAEVGHFAYDMSDRIIGPITDKNTDGWFSINPYEKHLSIPNKNIHFDKSTEGLYWYSKPEKQIKTVSTYDMRLLDAKIRVNKFKISIKAKPTSTRRSGKNYEPLNNNNDTIQTIENNSEFESYA